MNETQVRTTVLYEAPMIAALRVSLAAAQRRIEREAYEADETSDGFARVRLSCALEDAGRALFDALNVAHSYNHCDEAKSALGALAA